MQYRKCYQFEVSFVNLLLDLVLKRFISLKHGGGNILPDGTMLIMSVTEENVICPQHISGKHLNKNCILNKKSSKI